jgi:lipopolysaccharide/colanic/teichoic acid biosynthesis glycosyltransferase
VTIIVLLPVIFVVALAIIIDTRGSILFSQNRIGVSGKEFKMYKFRSMSSGAENQGPHFTSPSDTRITRVGKIIRKTSLDELPQLFNVLQGKMSIVGPRPNVLVQKSEYTEEEWNKRNSVRPGITGLAQATLRSSATKLERTQLDLEYVDKSSLCFDFWIILLTIKQIFIKGSH